MTKAIIFDLYGTLLETKVKTKPFLTLFKSLGLTKEEMTYWSHKVQTENFNSFGELKEVIKPGSSIYTDQLEYDVKEEIENTFVYSDTIQTLKRLKPHYRLFLLSNIATPYKQCFYNEGLDEFFEKVFFSCDIGYRKPELEAYKTILDYSGLKPKQLLMVGDSKVSDYEGALNSGIPALLKTKDISLLLSNYY
jgi:putative hydrolase of the HAD superfamily